MAKIVFVSRFGDCLPLAMRTEWEGHDPVVMLAEENYRRSRVGEGLVPLGPEPTPDAILAEKPDLVVFDHVGLGELASSLSGSGIPVFGGSLWSDTVELNRGYGYQLMVVAGIEAPQTHTFDSPGSALEFARLHRKTRWVAKPHGNLEPASTYVSRGFDDLLAVLESWQEDLPWMTLDLQEYAEGVEVSCEGWFNGEKFLAPMNLTFEEKRFMDRGVGPNTGCMGNMVRPISKGSRLVREGIGRIESILRAGDYRGPVDLNSIVTKDRLLGLEFTPRFGYDAVQALGELNREGLGDLLLGVATGSHDRMNLLHEWSIGIRLSVPPYPHKELSVEEPPLKVPVFGIDENNVRHLWPSGLRVEGGRYFVTSPDGNAMVVTAWGGNIREARRRAYRTIGNLNIPNVQYRSDIGRRVEDDWGKLVQWGWVS